MRELLRESKRLREENRKLRERNARARRELQKEKGRAEVLRKVPVGFFPVDVG